MTAACLPVSTALLTDMYELTMVETSRASGMADRECIFELFGRRLPLGRRYGVVAGTARALDAIEQFRFGDEEIEFLREAKVVGEETLDWLREFRFSGDIDGYGEGEIFFPGSPLLTVRGTFAEAVILETVLLSIYNHDCAVAAAASRMTNAAHGRPCMDMGARRTHEWAAVGAARAAVVGGFGSSSILESGRSHGIPVIGTAAHSFTLLHESEEDAFAAQIEAFGTDTTLLVDTYDVERGVENAVRAARAAGGELGAVRLDSGDLVAQAFKVRGQLDRLGATETRITVTSDLDEYAIAALGAAPVNSYGVGTRLVTGSGHPTAELVYKLVAKKNEDGSWTGVAKKSSSKKTLGGLKVAGRVLDEGGKAIEELIVSCVNPDDGRAYLAQQGADPLQVRLVCVGKIIEDHRGEGSLTAAAERHIAKRAQLPYQAWRLSDGEPGIPTRHVDLSSQDAAR